MHRLTQVLFVFTQGIVAEPGPNPLRYQRLAQVLRLAVAPQFGIHFPRRAIVLALRTALICPVLAAKIVVKRRYGRRTGQCVGMPGVGPATVDALAAPTVVGHEKSIMPADSAG